MKEKISIAITHPHLVEEWNDERDINTVTAGSHYKARWSCKKENHVWYSPVGSRARLNRNCPFCSNQKVLQGFNDLATTHPAIAAEWDDSRNELKSKEVTSGSDKKRYWVCKNDPLHKWSASILSRKDGRGCPYCSGNRVFTGFNDLATTHPEIAAEWNDEKAVSTVSAGMRYKAQWKCSKGHSYKVEVFKRTSGRNCPICSGKKILIGFNDLSTTHPEIAAEWSLNNKKTSQEVTAGSSYLAEWICREGHKYERPVYGKATTVDCPVCIGKIVLPGFNDLSTTHPEIAAEWNDESLSSYGVSAGSNKKVKWKCEKDHTWYAAVGMRTKKNSSTGCPKCAIGKTVSKAEKEIYDYISSVVNNDNNNNAIVPSCRDIISPYEVDIYIPELNFAIEFNGIYYHSEKFGKDKWYHYDKYNKCREKGVKLFQIWEDDYIRNPDLIKRMIAHRLGYAGTETVYARNTVFSLIAPQKAYSFLDENHIQKAHKTSSYYGLRSKTDDKLLAVMGVRLNAKKSQLEISRFATNSNVPGGFSKLLKNVLREDKYINVDNIISYSHNDHSWGEVYEKNGFEKVHGGTPGYHYVVNGFREHRLNYSPKRFREREDLLFEENKTERELAEMNSLTRIWDCGSTLWSKELI